MSSRLLAIETSSAACSVALCMDGQLHVREAVAARRHQERMPAMIAELLEEARLTRSDLTGVAFGRGPGSFTGLRLAAATAQAWGMAGGLPVFAVSSLAALALGGARQLDKQGPICALIKARPGEVYRGDYVWDGRSLETCGPEQRCESRKVDFERGAKMPAIVVGDGCLEVNCAGLAIEPGLLPSAKAVVALAEHAAPCEASAALPVYLQADSDWGR